jgi:hypothetical protein
LVLSQLNFIKGVTRNNNFNIVSQFWPIIYSLAPYCYRSNFPQLNNSFIKRSILELLYDAEISFKDSISPSKNMISFIEVTEAE